MTDRLQKDEVRTETTVTADPGLVSEAAWRVSTEEDYDAADGEWCAVPEGHRFRMRAARH